VPVLANTAEDLLHWLALTLVPGLGARRSSQLLERFRTPQGVFRASVSELEEAGLTGSLARSIAGGCSFDDAAKQHEQLLEHGAQLVSISDKQYPARLREIFDPPLVLFVKGRTELLQTLMFGVVGTRRPTQYGVAVAERMGADLAAAGLTIVSGMARGIDTSAHKGALNMGGNTVAVFGCGVDLLYPAENRKLYDEIAVKGLLVSEFPMGTPAYPQNFPIRNRIISGMSCGVLVVEGAQYSGSSITAKLAMDQGREVFAIPGNIVSKMSWGPNLLIKQGAKLVQDWNDVVSELPPDDRQRLSRGARTANAEQGALELDGPSGPLQQAILEHLQADSVTQIDDLLANLENYSSSETIAALFELEFRGLVKQLPGRNFVKVW